MKVLSTLAIFVAAAAAQSGAWGQCGGNGWTGATTCVSGYTCSVINEWYHQCVPGNGGGNNPQPTTTVPNPPTGTHQATLCSQYAYHSANGYEILNNLWGISGSTGRQCTYYDGPSGNGVAISTEWTWQGDPNTVKTYIWANPIFTRRRISDITSLPTTVQWSYNITDMRANVAYDIFTDPDPNHPNSSGQFELMIWLHRYGGIWPITESSSGSPVARVTIAGYAWDFYTGWNGSMRVYSFLAANGPINSFSADVKLFFNYLVQNQGFPASNQYMLIYNFGTEAFTGGPAYLRVPRFEARVN